MQQVLAKMVDTVAAYWKHSSVPKTTCPCKGWVPED